MSLFTRELSISEQQDNIKRDLKADRIDGVTAIILLQRAYHFENIANDYPTKCVPNEETFGTILKQNDIRLDHIAEDASRKHTWFSTNPDSKFIALKLMNVLQP